MDLVLRLICRRPAAFVLLGVLLGGGISPPAVASNAPPVQIFESTVVRLQLDAPASAPEKMKVAVYLPPDYGRTRRRYPVLYANDGQDMAAVGLQPTLARRT